MDMRFCQSCGMPIGGPNTAEARGRYCQHCADEQGQLHPREAVQQGVAMWLKSFSPESSEAEFMARADHYLSAMPAWAGK